VGNKPTLRKLLDVDLHEVSAVTWPAYPDTSVAMRTLRQFGPEQETAQRLNAMRIRLLTIPL
jgi:phage head maturation protease